ncbi:CHAD domain-containing protein [Mycobacterium sp. THU-M104]|uniref:CYTH and CHAD domain-containing protein n=1 Tax=Mycobacterium sp. THU-M104 TaxID=3410515 RepID=UPI003B9DAA76
MPAQAPKASRYLEVERKFDVADSAVSPSFDGITAVARVEKSPTQSLDATYFDTPAQGLARNKITLRRRTGGSDAGWHLKLPTGPDARTEVRVPLESPNGEAGREAVPGELLDIVLAIVRDHPLEPVARISTERETQVLYGADGAPLAEFSNDHVTAWSIGAAPAAQPSEQEWREWELELVTTSRAPDAELLTRLGNRLLDAGAAPAGHASKLARVLGPSVQPNDTRLPADPVHRAVAEQVGALLVWDRAVRADGDDAVHQMRVTIRKIRSLLGESAEFASSADAWVLGELQELGNVLGGARDAEVLGARYRLALDALTPELVRGGIRTRLIDGAHRRYQAGLRRSLAAMRSPRYFRLLDALDAVVAHPPAPAAGRAAAAVTIDAAYQKVRRAAKTAARAPEEHRDEALHRIRKRAKRLRYTGAATGAAEVSERAKAIQTLLGEHQDSVVSREHLLAQADAAHAAGEDTFTYGLLYQQETDLAKMCERQLDDALRQLDKSVRKAQR